MTVKVRVAVVKALKALKAVVAVKAIRPMTVVAVMTILLLLQTRDKLSIQHNSYHRHSEKTAAAMTTKMTRSQQHDTNSANQHQH